MLVMTISTKHEDASGGPLVAIPDSSLPETFSHEVSKWSQEHSFGATLLSTDFTLPPFRDCKEQHVQTLDALLA
jgi:hypothetical protein